MTQSQPMSQVFTDGLYSNPLINCYEDEIMEYVEAFWKFQKFEDKIDKSDLSLKMFKRGSLIAVDPLIYLSELQPCDSESNDAMVDMYCTQSIAVDASSEIATTTSAALETQSDRLSKSRAGTTENKECECQNTLKLPNGMKFRTPLENEALVQEEKRRPSLKCLTRETAHTLAVCAAGALAQGCAQESLVAANLLWPIDFGIASENYQGQLIFSSNGRTYFALVNATSWFAASVCGMWVSDPLTFYFGRRGALLTAAFLSFAAPIGAAYSQEWYQLLACRALSGISIASKSSIIPVLVSEIVPFRLRARLLVGWQVFVAAGVALTSATNVAFDGNWRLQIGITCCSALPLLFGCSFISESPYWLIKKGRYPEAFKVLRQLRPTTLQAARDLWQIYTQIKIEPNLFKNENIDINTLFSNPKHLEPSYWHRFRGLLEPRNRRAIFASWSVMASQQSSGINIFAFLASTVFDGTHVAAEQNRWFNFGFGMTNVLFSAITYFVIDKLGRRALLLSSLTFMVPFLFGTAHQLAPGQTNEPRILAGLVLALTTFYSFGAGVIPFLFSSEIFPIMYREIGMSMACSVNFALAGLLAFSIPQWTYSEDSAQTKSNISTIFWVFGGLTCGAVCLVFFLMRAPDEARSLEDMNFLYLGSSMEYVKYLLDRENFVVRAQRMFHIIKRSKIEERPVKKTFSEWLEVQEIEGKTV